MPDLEIFEPLAPRYPELLEESYGMPLHHIVAHDLCNLLLSRSQSARSRGIGIHVSPPGQERRPGGFTVSIDAPSGETSIFFCPDTDFDAVLPNAVIPRPDNPNKRMLTRSGKDQIITALRYGSIIGDFAAIDYRVLRHADA